MTQPCSSNEQKLELRLAEALREKSLVIERLAKLSQRCVIMQVQLDAFTNGTRIYDGKNRFNQHAKLGTES